MSRQVLLCIGLLLIGFAMGILFSSMGKDALAAKIPEQGGGALHHAVDPQAESQTAREKTLKSQIAQLEERLSRQKSEQEKALMADRLALFKKHAKAISFQPFDDDLKPSDALVDLLKLSPQEQTAIEEALAQAKRETTNLEDSKLTLVKNAGESMTYQIPAYPEGKAVEDNLKKQLSSTLGADWTDLLMEYSKSSFTEQFSAFGKESTQMEITRKGFRNGQPDYLLTEKFSMGPASWTRTRPIGTTLPKRYADLLQITPDK